MRMCKRTLMKDWRWLEIAYHTTWKISDRERLRGPVGRSPGNKTKNDKTRKKRLQIYTTTITTTTTTTRAAAADEERCS